MGTYGLAWAAPASPLAPLRTANRCSRRSSPAKLCPPRDAREGWHLGVAGMAQSFNSERYVVSLGCRVSIKGVAVTTVKWSVAHLPTGGADRPSRGEQSVGITCPRCSRNFSVQVESVAKARRNQLIYRAVGWLVLLSLLVTVPMLFHLGGQTVEEGDTKSSDLVGILFGLVALAVVAGPSFLVAANRSGVKKLRLVRNDGTKTALVQGHRMF